MIKRIRLIGLAVLTGFLLYSCMPSRKAKENSFLKKNDIQVKGNEVDDGDLEDFVQQESNKRILGVWWFKPWLYQQLEKGKNTGFKKWMKENLASPPVYYDPSMAVSSVDMMEQYLSSKGYFDAEVGFDTVENNNKTTVKYYANPKSPYRINDIEYQFEDTLLRPYVLSDTVNSLIEEGDKYDTYLLDDERDRITKNLRREGFYRFNKEYIRYLVDSALQGQKLDLYVQLLPRKYPSPDASDEMLTRSHKRYKIKEVIIKPDKKVLQTSGSSDTLEIQYRKSLSDTVTTPYTFIYDEPMRVKPKTYMRRVKLSPGSWYDFKEVQSTYDNLAGLGITRFVNIDFSEKKTLKTADTIGLLDCNIDINRKPVHSMSVETEGTNTAGRPGLASRLVYTNKNLFKGGEVFDISLTGAVEAQGGNEADNKFLIFNTIETGIDASLTIPHFLLPVSPEFFARDYHPYTNFNTGYNYQKRSDYVRYITNFSFGYRWRQSETKRHMLTPLNINAVKIFTEPSFEERLQELDKKYREQYTNHLLASLKYSFIYNTQNVRNGNDFFYLRSNFESSGVMMDFLSQTLGYGKQIGDYNTLFNIRYAQFLRTDFDFRYYHYLDKEQSLIFRSLFGIGLPYGNSDALPFEKGFYAGGANGMRGWQIRTLGPGAYDETAEEDGYDKIGDIQLEFNTEYRFPIYRFFEGALFVDAGNIWLLNESKDYPKGHFEFGDFLNQFAVDAGFGLRLDFQFFTLRVDAAIPFRQPSEPAGDRWKGLSELQSGDIFWNFGIGYPF
ncbi:MAG: outer membrane protein assembly factor [Bacteroidales bacterium]|nr:outer membrane protein assembly factor [Bacteroidales bacterium]